MKFGYVHSYSIANIFLRNFIITDQKSYIGITANELNDVVYS